MVALSKAVSSEPTEDHNNPCEFSAMSAFPSACYDSGSEDDDQEETFKCLVSRAHAYTKIIICLLVPVFYPGSLWALAGCFPQAIVDVIFLCLQVHLKTLVTVRVMCNFNMKVKKIVLIFPCFTK